jgi:hypothetical protein
MRTVSIETLVVLAVIALCLIGVYVTSRGRPLARRAKRTGRGASLDQAALSRTPLHYLDEAAQLAERGEARAALRALYLATLVNLDRAHLIDFEPAKTNWQYLRGLPPGELRKLFAAFTRIFDHKWYGHEPATPEDYRRSRALAERIERAVAARAPGERAAPFEADGR